MDSTARLLVLLHRPVDHRAAVANGDRQRRKMREETGWITGDPECGGVAGLVGLQQV